MFARLFVFYTPDAQARVSRVRPPFDADVNGTPIRIGLFYVEEYLLRQSVCLTLSGVVVVVVVTLLGRMEHGASKGWAIYWAFWIIDYVES